MKKFPWFVVLITTALGVSSGLLLFGLMSALHGDKLIGSADVAAWAQALASAFALVAAIWIAFHQSTVQRRTKREQELYDALRMSRLARAAVQRAVPEVEDFVRRILAWPPAAGSFVYDAYQLTESKALLDMAVAKIDHVEIVESLIAVHGIVGSILKCCAAQQGVVHPAGHSRVRMSVELWSTSMSEKSAVIFGVATRDEAALKKFQGGGL